MLRDLTSKLKREQAAHKITKDEMQKARNALTSVRTQAQVSLNTVRQKAAQSDAKIGV